MNKLLVVAIHGSEFMTRFMQDADMFERFKILAKATKFELTLKPDCTKTRALSDLKDLLEKSGHRVAAVFIPHDPEGAWRDEKVRVISNGTGWCMLDDYLDAYGFIQSEPANAVPA